MNIFDKIDYQVRDPNLTPFVVMDQIIPVGGAFVTDNFDAYADASSLDDAANWTMVAGTWAIEKPAADSVAYANSDAALSCIRYSTGTFSANQYAEATFEVGASSNAGFTGVAVRAQSGAATWYALYWSKQLSSLNISWIIAGTGAGDVDTEAAVVYSTGHKIRLEVTGTGAATRLTGKHDIGAGWVTVFDSLDPGASHYIDDGNPGVAGYDDQAGTGYDTCSIDDWAGGDL